jgi:sortase (surface protein transpeptidase)
MIEEREPLQASSSLTVLRGKQRFSEAGRYVLAVLGIVALGYWEFVFLNAKLYQARATRIFEERLQTKQLERQRDSTVRSSTVFKHEKPIKGSAIARLAIPRLGLTSIVIEGAGEEELSLAPGHIPGTALPGEAGNVAIAGHRDTFFRPHSANATIFRLILISSTAEKSPARSGSLTL